MTMQDSQKLKEMKNYKFDNTIFKNKDKQRMLDGFKAEIKFAPES